MMAGHENFSERTLGPAPLDQPEIEHNFWKGFVSLIWRLDDGGNFAEDFPMMCSDSPVPFGTASRTLGLAFLGHVPEMHWPLDPENLASNHLLIFDAIEFFYQHVSKPTSFSYHGFFKHKHIDAFDQQAGKEEYRTQINQLFRRNRHPYELQENGYVERIAPPILDSTLHQIRFHTGDSHLDILLETARSKFFDSDPAVRKESPRR